MIPTLIQHRTCQYLPVMRLFLFNSRGFEDAELFHNTNGKTI
jgi:hypothetical protein